MHKREGSLNPIIEAGRKPDVQEQNRTSQMSGKDLLSVSNINPNKIKTDYDVLDDDIKKNIEETKQNQNQNQNQEKDKRYLNTQNKKSKVLRNTIIWLCILASAVTIVYIQYKRFPAVNEEDRYKLRIPRNVKEIKGLVQVLKFYEEQHYTEVLFNFFFLYVL